MKDLECQAREFRLHPLDRGPQEITGDHMVPITHVLRDLGQDPAPFFSKYVVSWLLQVVSKSPLL